MVFVSLESFLQGAAASDLYGKPAAAASTTRVSVPHAQLLPQAAVHVVVTPGSPAKPSVSSAAASSSGGQKRSRLRRATSAFSSFTTTKTASPTDVAAVSALSSLVADQFVMYVTDRDMHHKWVLAKSPAEYLMLKKTLQAALGGCACRQFVCCGPLRRVVGSSQYKKPKRRWSDSRVAAQFVHCTVIQEFLNDLLLAVLRRDDECDATRLAWDALSTFLDVEIQRSDAADKILLGRIGEPNTPTMRRSMSEQLPPRRTSIVCEQESVVELGRKTSTCSGCDDCSSHEPESADDEDAECPICCASLDGDGELTKTARLLCGHKYHAECVRVWLRLHHTCPVCRIPIEGM